ncbi:MAG: hypothetical protein ACYC6L_06465 [Anaerolineae bacterium]
MDEKELRELVHWEGRIPRHKIARLYELDAQGIVDAELIDEVAFGCVARCQSILQVTRAYEGVVTCPVCQAEIRHQWQRRENLVCANCGWQVLLETYARTFLGKHLHGGSAMDVWRTYLARFPAAETPQARMLLIDWLIHAVHQSTRSVAVQLIGGTPRQVLALLDNLAYGDCSTPGLAANRRAWRTAMVSGAYRAAMPADNGAAADPGAPPA